ncbi:hypothetical protein [Paenibacillus sp. QZ-Y1]|uniref:hypothetical protein n=1 Tax=Paenibacillus sp. QZ-Y1 TaxID=3414511 RepID=UPI003F7AC58E
MQAVVTDNSGYSSTHGKIEDLLSLGEQVEVLYQDECCFKIKKVDGYEATLNIDRFKTL